MKQTSLSQKYKVIFLLLITIHSNATNKQVLHNTNEAKYYVGVGLAYMNLTDSYSDESFSANPYTIQIGYKANEYFSIESRYTRSYNVKYNAGKTTNTNNNDFSTVFTNFGLYMKPIMSYDALSLYALLGYGQTKLTNIKGSNRVENAFQWGGGASYAIGNKFNIFTDYAILYRGRGFGGRAQKQIVDAYATTVGVSYEF